MEITLADLNPIVTLMVGLFAFVLYFLKERKTKTIAAKIIWLEVLSTENRLKELKESGLQYTDKPVLRNNNWDEYKHLLIGFFDNDEFVLLDEFYKASEYIEYQRVSLLLIRQSSALAKGNAIQSELMANITKNISNKEEMKRIRSEFISISDPEAHMFIPEEPSGLTKKQLETLRFVTGTSTATKLKKISNRKL